VKGVKNPATRAPHPGYWWQAFDPTNFRYSCIVANRRRRDLETGRVGGKADEFPLWEEKKRAWKPQDDCNEEQPLLLDPCNPADVALITFAENGEAIPRYSEQDKPRLYARAKKSEELYHLNHSDFVKARINIRVQLEKLIEDSERYYRKLDNGDATNDYAYMRAIVQLREACSEKAPFSSFALAYLQPYRTKDSLVVSHTGVEG
jgi:hypothetical protein